MPASRDSNLSAVPDGVHRHGDTGTDFPPRYDGPKSLSQALTQLTRGDEAFTRDGPRADVERAIDADHPLHMSILRRVLRNLPTPARLRARLVAVLVDFLIQPVKGRGPVFITDTGSLSAVLRNGDVLLTEGNTRAAALVKRLTRSTWSHVSMYVGPLDDGPDPSWTPKIAAILRRQHRLDRGDEPSRGGRSTRDPQCGPSAPAIRGTEEPESAS